MVNDLLKKLIRINGYKPVTLKKSELNNNQNIETKVTENIDGSYTIECREE